MIFNIIIPFYKNYDTIEGLLRSIKDQDFTEHNTTIVIDGEDPKARKQLEGYLECGMYKFKLEELVQNKGAAKARNFGASMSLDKDADYPDDILFFVDADCKLMPGILYEFNERFESYRTIDFVYGNYRFEIDKPPFISQPFDPYLLETMNYISTMSPVRRFSFDEVGGFDEDRTYFQDWGLFYKLVKNEDKGLYLGDKQFVFSTVSPTEESISGSHGMTISEKCKEFRNYYNITDKEIVVSTWGAPLQAIQRAKILGADYVGCANGSDRMVFPTNYNFENWKYTYMVGCYNSTMKALENHMTSICGRPIYHFIGTDVFTMFNVHSTSALIHINKMFKVQNAVLLSNSSRCQKELKRCGIETELIYTPIYEIYEYESVCPLPEKFTVAVYVSDTNRSHMMDGAVGMSNIPLIVDVARAMPDIEFKFFGIENMYDKTGNIEHCGRIPESHMNGFINECSMVLRSTVHDGFPQLPIQFMLADRQALVSCPDEEMKYAEKLSFEDNMDWEANKNEMITKIYEMRDKKVSEEAYQYYKELMCPKVFKEKIYKLLEENEN